jgi:hypothetical protein
LKLLDPMQAQLKLGSGQEMSIGGFMVVNRERLKEVSADKLAELATVDELELIYLHLQSMQNVADLGRRIKPDSGHQAAAEGAAEAAGQSDAEAPSEPEAKVGNKAEAAPKKKSAAKKKARSGSSGNGKDKE